MALTCTPSLVRGPSFRVSVGDRDHRGGGLRVRTDGEKSRIFLRGGAIIQRRRARYNSQVMRLIPTSDILSKSLRNFASVVSGATMTSISIGALALILLISCAPQTAKIDSDNDRAEASAQRAEDAAAAAENAASQATAAAAKDEKAALAAEDDVRRANDASERVEMMCEPCSTTVSQLGAKP